MNKNSKILISGAGVAGLTAAIWLGRHGFKPIIVEKSPSIRADGYIVSLSHASYHYAAQLGLLEKIRARNSGIRQSSYHDRRGKAMLTLDFKELFVGVDVVQIMRDDLEEILFDEARHLAEFRLATTITAIEQDAECANVTFSDGRHERFDVVIGADGLHSNTRSLVFPDAGITRRYLGLFSSAYRLPNVVDMAARFENHMEQTRYMCVYTTRRDDLACLFIWQSDKREAPPPDARRAELEASFASAPALVQRVIDAFPEDATVYMDPLIQIEMRRWSRGHVVLLGDAAHCLTLLSGQGASTAFWGACTLCEGLVAGDKAAAFAAYESALKPVVDEMQPATRLAAKWYIPQSRLRYVMRDNAMRYLPDVFFQRYFKNKYTKA